MAKPIADLVRDPFEAEQIVGQLKRGQATTEGLSAVLGESLDVILHAIAGLIRRGVNIQKFGEHWSLGQPLAPRAEPEVYVSRRDGTYVFGIASDAHLCSKYARLDVLNRLYDWFAEVGVDRVYNAGNWIDGEDVKNRQDLLVHGLEPQVDYLVQNFPTRAGFKTYAVWGDDHEGWFARREAIDIGRFTEGMMRQAGRTDWVDLGHLESNTTLRHRRTRVDAQPLLVMHPGGGSAYAISYRPQKIVESLQGAAKPAVLVIGHYHKISVNLIRSVWAIQAGCTQDQTAFLRRLSIEPHLGGMIVTLEQDPVGGAIVGCDVQFRQYFDKVYENARWSKSGPVVHPEKIETGVRRRR